MGQSKRLGSLISIPDHITMPEYPSTYVCSRQVKLKIKVNQCHGVMTTERRGRVTVDRDTISYEKLRRHLIKLFRLKTAFLITYDTARAEGPLAISDDWDLDAALQQCRHTLRLTVSCSVHRMTSVPADFDVLSTTNLSAQMFPLSRQNSVPLTRNSSSQSMLGKLASKLSQLVFHKDSETNADAESSPSKTSKSPMSMKEYQTFLDSEGRLVDQQAFRESVYRGGVCKKLRKIVWRHLLNVFPEGMTGTEREAYLERKANEYTDLKNKWKTVYRNSESDLPDDIRFVTNMVKKDVVRTDRKHSYYKGKEDNKHIISLFDLLCTYALNHPDVSYCQGMCDYASTILVVQDNEANAYLLFCALMERIKFNFSYDGKAISTKFEHLVQLLKHFDKEFFSYMQEHQVDDLLFAYRWILLEMKREFPYEDSLMMTEVMWSTIPTTPRYTEVPLYQLSNTENLFTCPNPLMLISPYARLNDMSDHADTVSNVSESSQYCDSEPLSIDQSEIDRICCIEKALNNFDADSICSEVNPTSSSVISEPVCACDCHMSSEPLGLEAESRSTFYIKLEEEDYFFEDNGEYCGLSSAVIQPCQCGGSSTDSGFQSRPASPTKAPESSSTNLEESGEVKSLFPPPHEFGFGNPFILFTALTMILNHRDTIMGQKMDFNEILMLFNGAMRKNDVIKVLLESKMLYEAYLRNELLCSVDEFELI